MREILFKAKRFDNEEWVEGYYAFVDNVYYIYTGELCNGGLYVVAERFEVDPSTLCQYTGLTDKNGKLIFENDYISCKQYIGGNQIDYHVELGYVEMKHGAFGLHRKQGYYRPFKDWLEDYEYEVIGNIFDNLELLGGVLDGSN